MGNKRGNLEDLQLESYRSAGSAGSAGNIEPLMPAAIKPAKEKSASNSKQYESGEGDPHEGNPREGNPGNPREGNPGNPRSPVKPTSLAFAPRQNDSSSSDTTPEEEYKTPSVENVPLPGEHLIGNSPSQSTGQPQSSRKQYEAFYVDTDNAPLSHNGPTPRQRPEVRKIAVTFYTSYFSKKKTRSFWHQHILARAKHLVG